MVVSPRLIDWLFHALQDPRTGMAPDEAPEVARRYPQNVLSDSPRSEAQTHVLPPVDLPQHDPNFRQLSRAPIVAQAQEPESPKGRSSAPDYDLLWSAPPENGTYGARSTLPWWAPPPAPFLPVPGRKFLPTQGGGLGAPMPLPYWPSTSDLQGALGPILELFRRTYSGGGGGGRGRDRAREDGEDDNFCDRRRYAEDARCYRSFPKSLHECLQNSETRKNQCYANGRTPDPNERRLWNRADEEDWFNSLR